MNYKVIFLILILFLTACQNANNKKNLPSTEIEKKDIIKKTSQDNVAEEKEEVKKEIEDEACESCTI